MSHLLESVEQLCLIRLMLLYYTSITDLSTKIWVVLINRLQQALLSSRTNAPFTILIPVRKLVHTYDILIYNIKSISI